MIYLFLCVALNFLWLHCYLYINYFCSVLRLYTILVAFGNSSILTLRLTALWDKAVVDSVHFGSLTIRASKVIAYIILHTDPVNNNTANWCTVSPDPYIVCQIEVHLIRLLCKTCAIHVIRAISRVWSIWIIWVKLHQAIPAQKNTAVTNMNEINASENNANVIPGLVCQFQ